MRFARHPAALRVRTALPVAAEIVYAVGSLWISAAMLRNWPDPNGYWRDTDPLAYALLAAVYLPLALRRRFPVAILVSTGICVATYFTLGYYHVVAGLVLRDGDTAPAAESAAPVAGFARLDELAERVADAGVPVDVRVTGTAYELPAGIDLCAYRVVQEALTNVIKHAPGARTTVRVHYGEDEVRVRVENAGSGRSAGRPSAGPAPAAGAAAVKGAGQG
ncbi:hypothetical protein OHA91_03500 [Streptomyces erythrochromogenes]|uniref:histidine kinase n=2 Tax=Streptomyces erythrochromogenes TaxID=285574 RepID=A0ABZ1Q6U8_9ACTN|nr:ATP-binding protein [Streptomyces erythrochromogenes]MCX5583516.1 hypothetical protein [Streptomyces erythrochromogenes]